MNRILQWFMQSLLCDKCGMFIEYDHDWNSCKCEDLK